MGINACVRKGLIDFINKEAADIFCFQEVKASEDKLPEELKELKDYFAYHSFADKKGYSGVSVLTKIKPLKVIDKFDSPHLNGEGRLIVCEFNDFFLANVYFPHSNRKLTRLDFKLKFNDEFQNLCKRLELTKPIIISSDFNVAHKEIDLRNPKQNVKNAGFTKEERKWFDDFLKLEFIDTFRYFNSEGGNYTWWTYRNNARDRNVGWRIDYFVVSYKLLEKISNSEIMKEVLGSDHCPIKLDIKI